MKRGRPKADYSTYIRQQFNELEIIGIRKSDRWGHPRCRTKCLRCAKESTKRLYSVISGASKTCSCGSKQKFKDYWINRASALSDNQRERIWCAVRAADSVKGAAETLGRPRYLVSFASRKHQARLDSLPTETVDAIWTAAQREGIGKSAEEFGLHPQSMVYLVIKRHRSPPDPGMDPADLHAVLNWMRTEKSKKRDWDDPSGGRRNEFTKGELSRKQNGQVVGGLSDLYRKLSAWRPSQTTHPDLVDLVAWFLETAENTFSARQQRRKNYLEEKRREKMMESERADRAFIDSIVVE